MLGSIEDEKRDLRLAVLRDQVAEMEGVAKYGDITKLTTEERFVILEADDKLEEAVCHAALRLVEKVNSLPSHERPKDWPKSKSIDASATATPKSAKVGDVIVPDNPPICCGMSMELFDGELWDCQECDCQIRVDTRGAVVELVIPCRTH